MPRTNYFDWQSSYTELGSALHLRLVVIRDLLEGILDDAPEGPVRIISMCAGQGRDVLTVARRHRRGKDFRGVLVELDRRNVDVANEVIDREGLHGLRALEGDAGWSTTYEADVPADLIVAAGMFGNIRDDEVEQVIAFLPAMCSPTARVLWTQYPRDDEVFGIVSNWFTRAGFSNEIAVVPPVQMFGVCVSRLARRPDPYRPDLRLFSDLR